MNGNLEAVLYDCKHIGNIAPTSPLKPRNNDR